MRDNWISNNDESKKSAEPTVQADIFSNQACNLIYSVGSAKLLVKVAHNSFICIWYSFKFQWSNRNVHFSSQTFIY